MHKENQILFNKLRKEWQTFVFEQFKWEIKNNTLELRLYFSCGDITFQPFILFPLGKKGIPKHLKTESIDNLAFNIGMIEALSYWKAFCSPKFVVKPYFLKPSQISWWKKLYFHGLGEFFYTNNISTNIDDFISISSISDRKNIKFTLPNFDNYLVPIGGGKDSAVTLELLLSAQKSPTPFAINPRKATFDTISSAKIEKNNSLFVKRHIDPKLLELNKKGFLNGHTPFSAMLAFTSLMTAALSEHQNIALSNESSANEATIIGSDINHQYSKSWEFENDFREYVSENITDNLNYFSFLRPLSELQIAAIFSQLKNHHHSFRSCNVGSKTDIWCNACSKCLFTWLILSPFLSPEKLTKIFGENLISKKEMKIYFSELRGEADSKPFECVGTVEEVNIAIETALALFPENGDKLLFKDIATKERTSDSLQLFRSNLQQFDAIHSLDKELFSIIKNRLETIV